MCVPRRLYKYLCGCHVQGLVDGQLLFRSLSYFRQVEHAGRGDIYEGMHVDHPEGGVTITNLSRGTVTKGDFAFINRVRPDLIYCLCFSQRLHPHLFDEFSSDSCVEVTDVSEFLRRVALAVEGLKSPPDWELMHRPVEYYASNQTVQVNIKEPRNLPFFKLSSFSQQSEYRLVAAPSSAFHLIQEIVDTAAYDFSTGAAGGATREIRLQVGSIEDIAIVHKYRRGASSSSLAS